MKAIDTHLHLNDKISDDINIVAQSLDNDLIASGVVRGIVLHLLIQKWSYQDVGEALKNTKCLKAFQNVNPYSDNALKELSDGIQNYGFVGLKLHPRLQSLKLSDPEVISLCQHAGSLKVPVLIDAFPDGNAIMDNFTVVDFANLAKSCRETKFIWAHFGGHRVIDFMMVAKRLENVFLDLSYTWLYYRGSSVITDLAYAAKSMRYNKIFYGSDYPDRSIKESLEESIKQFGDYNISPENIEKLLFSNARDFFGWEDL